MRLGMRITLSAAILATLTSATLAAETDALQKSRGMILDGKIIKPYVEAFNRDDEELYSNIKNANALGFLDGNIPLLECPDKDIKPPNTEPIAPAPITRSFT